MKAENEKTGKKRKKRFAGAAGGRIRACLILAFAVVYALSMLLATWVDQIGKRNDYSARISMLDEEIWDGLREGAQRERSSPGIEQETGRQNEWQTDKLYEALSAASMHSSEYQLVSAAAYDADGNLAAQSTNLLSMEIADESGHSTVSWPLQEYLTGEEVEALAGYIAENYRPHDYAGVTYEIETGKSAVGDELEAIRVRRLFYSSEDVKEAGNIGPVWEWKNTDSADTDKGADDGDDSISEESLNMQTADYYFPGMQRNRGMDGWREWMENDYLQEYPEVYTELRTESSEGYFVTQSEISSPLFLGEYYARPDYTLVIRSVEYPWKAAFDSLTHIYLWGGILTVLCAAFVLYFVERTLRRRVLLEQRQRDFTNAIAHEMKTPLAVIRGFAENLEENVNKEKQTYYVEQIIGQTERMDDMVKEMVYISKLDSEEYRPVKEQISVRELLSEITAAYSAQLEEKHIEVNMICEDDFLIHGEKRFIQKAFTNLIANAVDHNRYEGKIRINIEKDKCVIQNTGEKIPADDLPHVCELFFTRYRSQGTGEKHLGVGLYLAERIFRMHRLRMKIENTDAGVRVIIR